MGPVLAYMGLRSLDTERVIHFKAKSLLVLPYRPLDIVPVLELSVMKSPHL